MFPKATDPTKAFEIISVNPDEEECYLSLDQEDFLERLPLTWDEDGKSLAGVMYIDDIQNRTVMATLYEIHIKPVETNPFLLVKRRLLKLYVRQDDYEEVSMTTAKFCFGKENTNALFESMEIGGVEEEASFLDIDQDLWNILLQRLNSHVITAEVEMKNERLG